MNDYLEATSPGFLIYRKKLLKFISICSLITAVLVWLLNYIYSPFHIAVYMIPVFIITSCISLLLVIRNKIIISTILLAYSAVAMIAFNMVLGKGLFDPGILVLPVIIIASSIFLTRTMMITLTSFIVLLIISVGIFQKVGYINKSYSVSTGLIIVYSLLIIMTGLFMNFIMINSEKVLKSLFKAIKDLKDAIERIDELEHALPICSNCKKIRKQNMDPQLQESWQNLELYLKEKKNMDFTHGICPDCIKKLYPEYYEKKQKTFKKQL